MIKSQYLEDKFALIERNITIAKSVNDLHLASMLSGYLVVSISGIYEDCIEHLFIQRAGKKNDREMQNLIKTLIDRHFRNPNYGKVKELVKALDSEQAENVLREIDIRSKQALDSIVNNKNNIAHGKVSNATIGDIEGYHEDVLEIFEALEKILLS